jgi:hypothetical protein
MFANFIYNKCLGAEKITDAALVHLPKLEELRHLELYYCSKITDVSLEKMNKVFKSPTNFDLFTFLKYSIIFIKLHSLVFLDLYYCSEITDTGLSNLSGLTKLEV